MMTIFKLHAQLPAPPERQMALGDDMFELADLRRNPRRCCRQMKFKRIPQTATSSALTAAAANGVAVGVAVGSQRQLSMRFCQLKVKIKTKSKCNELLGMQWRPSNSLLHKADQRGRCYRGGVVRRGKEVAKAAALEKFKLCAKRPTATTTKQQKERQ